MLEAVHDGDEVVTRFELALGAGALERLGQGGGGESGEDFVALGRAREGGAPGSGDRHFEIGG